MTFLLNIVHTDGQTRYRWLIWYIKYQVRQHYTHSSVARKLTIIMFLSHCFRAMQHLFEEGALQNK